MVKSPTLYQILETELQKRDIKHSSFLKSIQKIPLSKPLGGYVGDVKSRKLVSLSGNSLEYETTLGLNGYINLSEFYHSQPGSRIPLSGQAQISLLTESLQVEKDNSLLVLSYKKDNGIKTIQFSGRKLPPNIHEGLKSLGTSLHEGLKSLGTGQPDNVPEAKLIPAVQYLLDIWQGVWQGPALKPR